MNADRQAEPQIRPFLKLLRLLEFTAIFFAAPYLYAFLRLRAPGGRLHSFPVIPLLLLFAAGCLAALLGDRRFCRRRLWNTEDFDARLTRVVRVFVVAGGGLTAAVLAFDRAAFLSFVRTAPAVWAIIMVLYPLLSVYPQELVFRAFLFHRYRPVFPRPWMMIAASAVAFGFAHIVFLNPLAVALSVAGGVLFALTYERTRSLLMCSLEHAFYGCLIFTVGLGGYFFHGTARIAEMLSHH